MSFSVTEGLISRKGAKAQSYAKKNRRKSKSQRLQWPWRGAFEEPARAHAQAMMPGRQTRSVHRKSRLPRQWPADYFASGQNCRAFSPQADRFAKFDEVFSL